MAFADDVAAVIDAAAIDGPVTLVGQSVGAHTAFVAAARHPRLVDRLVMIEGDVGGGDDARLASLRTALASWPTPFSDDAAALAFFGDDAVGRAWAGGLAADADGRLRPRWDLDVMLRTMEPVFGREMWAEWASLSQPTLLVLGERSAIDCERVERMRAARPTTRLVTIANAGHDLHLEQPEAWLHALAALLAEPCGDDPAASRPRRAAGPSAPSQ